MEAKKTTKADLIKWRQTFFNVGLSLSLCLVLLAFKYQTTAPAVAEMVVDQAFDNVNPMPQTIQKPPTPPKPKLIAPIIEEIPDEEEPEVKPEYTFEPNDEDIRRYVDWEIEEETPPPPPFEVVEHPAAYPGGEKALFQYLAETIKYPTRARRMGLGGRVFVKFIVNEDGSISDAHVVRGIDPECDAEALEAIKAMPNWEPPRQRGRKVRQWIMIPVNFKLK